MRFLVLLVLGAFVLSGCIGENAAKTTLSPTPPFGKKVYDNSTLEGVLQNTPHINILGPATLAWALPNGTKEKPMVEAHLVYIGGRVKSALHDVNGLQMVAFIPVEAQLSGCQKSPSDARAFFQPRDVSTGNNNQKKSFGNLSGEYAPGWYHVVLVGLAPGDFTISFDVEKALTPRKLPSPDPYAGGGGLSVSGGREITKSVAIAEGWWYAWGAHQLPTQNLDGGRTHTVSIGGCQTTKTTSSSGFNQGDRTITVTAAGTQPTFEVVGKSEPTLAATAATTSILEAAWAWAKPIPVQSPSATAAAS